MRRAAILLNIIRERGKRGLPVNEIYRTLYQVDLYLLAYYRQETSGNPFWSSTINME